MKARVIFIVGVIALMIQSSWAAAQPAQQPSPPVAFEMDVLANAPAFLRSEIEAGKIPGAVLHIDQNGEPVMSAMLGQRNPDAAEPMSADTIFRLFSLTKPITSFAALMLVDEGRMRLDDPVAKYIPAFAQTMVGVPVKDADGTERLSLVPQQRAMTIRDLLLHTSGIPYGFYGNTLVRKAYAGADLYAGDPDNAEFANRIAQLPLEVQPGTLWDYGHSTDVLGRVIEVVTGQSLENFMRDALFAPLGMNDTRFDVSDPALRHRLAMPAKGDSDFRTTAASPPEVRRRMQSGGGGLYSTLHDMSRFAQMILDGGVQGERRFLSPALFNEMTRDHIGKDSGVARDHFYFPGDGFGFGYGFAVRTEPGIALPSPPGSLGELKWDSASGCYLIIDRKQKMFALLLQQSPSERQRIQTTLKRLIYEALEPPGTFTSAE